nr:MAG TPA: hypothetical protein [Caudoviricetes sp.]
MIKSCIYSFFKIAFVSSLLATILPSGLISMLKYGFIYFVYISYGSLSPISNFSKPNFSSSFKSTPFSYF